MTEEAISKLPKKAKHYRETQSFLIQYDIQAGHEFAAIEDEQRIRGYVECLRDFGILTQMEVRLVYIYYRSTYPTLLLSKQQPDEPSLDDDDETEQSEPFHDDDDSLLDDIFGEC